MSLTKADLADYVARQADLTRKAAKEAVDAVFKGIADSLKKGDKAVITGFGTFSVRKRAPRPGRNPQTGASIQIAARKTPGFTAGKTLKRSIRQKSLRARRSEYSIRQRADGHERSRVLQKKNRLLGQPIFLILKTQVLCEKFVRYTKRYREYLYGPFSRQ